MCTYRCITWWFNTHTYCKMIILVLLNYFFSYYSCVFYTFTTQRPNTIFLDNFWVPIFVCFSLFTTISLRELITSCYLLCKQLYSKWRKTAWTPYKLGVITECLLLITYLQMNNQVTIMKIIRDIASYMYYFLSLFYAE